MKKKIILLIMLFIGSILLSGCDNKKAIEFKNDYEKLNNQVNSTGKVHRSISIDKNNPFEEVTLSDIVKKIDAKDTFYVYFGSSLCPWCRSTIEKAIEVSKKFNIKKIYYVDVWDDNGKELFRDTYKLENNKVIKTLDGSEDYYKLLNLFKDKLRDYNLTDDNKKDVLVGEKRIYAPNYMYIKNGKLEKLTTGKSNNQKDSREVLSEQILKDEEDKFNEFFNN